MTLRLEYIVDNAVTHVDTDALGVDPMIARFFRVIVPSARSHVTLVLTAGHDTMWVNTATSRDLFVVLVQVDQGDLIATRDASEEERWVRVALSPGEESWFPPFAVLSANDAEVVARSFAAGERLAAICRWVEYGEVPQRYGPDDPSGGLASE